MDKVKSFHSVLCGLGIVGFLFTASIAVAAQDKTNKVVLSSAVFVEVEVENAEGKKEIKRMPVAKALPGSELIYVTTYKNTGDKPAENLIITNPLAKELIYKDQSAQGENAAFSVSVDGGKHYGDLSTLRIPTTEGATRPAQAGDITHLQFKLSNKVLPQEEGTVTFRVVLK